MSLRTMTAPAVGHRPLEPGIGVDQPLDDLVETVQRTPRDNSDGDVVSDAQNTDRAAADKIEDVAQERATQNDAVKEDVVGTTRDAAAEDEVRKRQEQEEREKQSAANSLLAQILGNESSRTETPDQPPPTPVVERITEVPPNDQPPQEDRPLNNADPNQVVGDQAQETKDDAIKVESREPATDADNQQSVPVPSTSGGMGENTMASQMPDMTSGATEDPLSKTSNESNGLFAPFDAGATNPPNMMDDMISNPFMNQNVGISDVDLSGLPAVSGYPSTDPYDNNTATSVSGSEPRIQAFAKLEFDDGHFYVNTYSFILGRDVRAARAAYQRELQARQNMSGSSRRNKNSGGDSTSHTPKRKREGSAVIGSVVSDCGGIMGYDPDIPPRRRSQLSHRESHGSLPESALHASPAQLQTPGYTDYNALAMQSLGEGDARPVDTLALLPSPDACPTIPIHPPAAADGSAAGHKGISRKHVKIAYNFDKNLFEMEVIGRNGAFIGADWLAPGEVRPLHSGDYIQIGGVRIRFLLPDVPIGETGADRVEEANLEEESAGMSAPVSADPGEADQMSSHAAKAAKLPEKPSTVEGNQEIVPPKRRGPGRPPKDGIMSKRERAELAREQKLAAKREANGGVTPPPLKMKMSKPRKEESAEDPSKQDKKKSAKRKLPDGSDVPLPSIEGGEPAQQQAAEAKPPPPKKRKPSRSPSPDYPPESAYTEEQLAKPPYNYAVLIFDALSESKTPMTLKQIYRALKLKYPYFRFKCETEGWTSSVRHNLNGNRNLFEHAERDGKGWSWQLVAGATVDKEKKRRPSPPPSVQNLSQSQNNASARDQQQRQQQQQRQHYMPPPGHQFHHQGMAIGPHGQQFQYQSMPPNRYNPPAPAPQHAPSYPPQPSFKPHPQAPHSAPSQDVKIPAGFSRPAPSAYSSPYKSNLPPELSNHQRQQQQQQQQQFQSPPIPGSKPAEVSSGTQNVQHPQHLQSYGPPASHPTYPPSSNGNVHHAPMPPPPGQIPPQPPPQPQLQRQPQPQVHQPQQHQAPPQPHQHPPPPPYPSAVQATPAQPGQQMPAPEDNGDSEPVMSFEERANKAIDDFEAVLMEDYDDKEYIREVLKSARARALGHAQESSFPGGEPKDEAVILDALKNLIGSLKGEQNGGA